MNSEDIKALGLRVGDMVRVTQDHRIGSIDGQEIIDDIGQILYVVDIIAIERVMPELDEGWEWNGDVAREVSGTSVLRVVYMRRDYMMNVETSGRASDRPIPGIVAKALLEAWEQRR